MTLKTIAHLPALVSFVVLSCAPPLPPGPAGPVELVVLGTADVHGRLRAWDYYANSAEPNRGLARAATIVDSVRAANPGRVILLDAGDLLQGNPLAFVAARVSANRANPIVAAMNAMRYDAAAIGNHEYNYGVPYLDSVVKQASFPLLSANTFRVEPRDIHAYRPWIIVEREGIKVGIVGATTPGVTLWDAENIKGRLWFGDIVAPVRTAVAEVRAAGADVVVLTIHSGLNEPSSYDTVSSRVPSENVSARVASEVLGIDLILYGHSHRESRGTTIGQTLLIQPKNWATSVSVAKLRVERNAGKWAVTARSGELIQAAGHAESPAVVAATDRAHSETVGWVTTEIGTTAERWTTDSARVRDAPLIDFILETQRKAAGTDLSSTAAFSTELAIEPGSVTIAQVAQLYPYDNTLRAIRITGRELRAYLEFSARYWRTPASASAPLEPDPSIPGYNFDIVSGVDYVIDVTRPIGSRVTTLDYKGSEVRDVDTFTMALNNYRQTGGGGYAMLSGAPVLPVGEPEIRQVLIDEVRRRGQLRQSDYFVQNWRLVRGSPAAAAGGAAATSSFTDSVRGPAFPAGTRFLRIIGTNDFHGALEPRPDVAGVRRGGAAHVARAIDNARRECAPRCEVLLVDGGDMWQGTSISAMSYGKTGVEYYNRMGYAAAALGNHEFDWGTDTLRARMREARFGILGANVRYTDGRDVEWIRNDTIVARGSTRVGIIGLSTIHTGNLALASHVAGLRFDSTAPIVDSIGRALRRRGANFVVVIAHAGAFCENRGTTDCAGEIVDLAKNVTTKVDAIVSGHTHSRVNAVINGIPIVQARTGGRAIDIVDIPITGRADLGARQQVRELGADTLPAVPSIDTIVRRAAEAIAVIKNRHIVTIPETLPRRGNQYPLGNLVADAQRWAGKGDVGIMNNGGIRTELRGGAVTYGSLIEIHPFGNTLHSIRMTGTQLRGLLEEMLAGESLRDHVSGLTVKYDPARPKGSRVVSVVMSDGTPLADQRSYNVIMNNFMIGRGGGYNAAASIPSTPVNISDIDALIGYLQQLPAPITAPTEVRIATVR